METHLSQSPPHLPSILAVFIFFFFILPPSLCDEHEACDLPFECGSIRNVWYPFFGDKRPQFCGHEGFLLTCENGSVPILEFNSLKYRVLNINRNSYIVRLARTDLWDDTCPAENLVNTDLDYNLFSYHHTVKNLSLFYDCTKPDPSQQLKNEFGCPTEGRESAAFYINQPEGIECKVSMKVPVLQTSLSDLTIDTMKLKDVVNGGFDVVYQAERTACLECEKSGGICGSNLTTQIFVCYCHDGSHPFQCPRPVAGKSRDYPLKLGIGFGAAFVGGVITWIIFYYYRRRNKKLYAPSSLLSRNISSDPSSVRDLEKEGNINGVHLFSYRELEEATNNFDSSKEVGDGGFGTVYYGKLQDGRTVAVKRLYENNYKRVEQFMNEVKILTRLRHQNLVSLYGSTSRHSRELLLVYEYVPNGTVADHLHGERAKPGALLWPTRMKIAIETASALTYLHASDIIHRDVKTNNILLDNSFCVKVADFGLSRLFPTDVTHISTAPQGTPGYVDPEYHQCYHLTDKSDVFSFGVVLIELISSKPAVDITRHRHEINLSNMAINKIQSHALHELVDPCLGYESDYRVTKMINAVAELAFQCLQNGMDMRPSMVVVLESLKFIQSDVYSTEKAEELDIPADDAVLLKSGQQTQSPDSVTIKWISNTTTPNTSV